MFINPVVPTPYIDYSPVAPQLWSTPIAPSEPRIWQNPHIHYQLFNILVIKNSMDDYAIAPANPNKLPQAKIPSANFNLFKSIGQIIAPNGKSS
jgi:hypothetical protein